MPGRGSIGTIAGSARVFASLFKVIMFISNILSDYIQKRRVQKVRKIGDASFELHIRSEPYIGETDEKESGAQFKDILKSLLKVEDIINESCYPFYGYININGFIKNNSVSVWDISTLESIDKNIVQIDKECNRINFSGKRVSLTPKKNIFNILKFKVDIT